jgi:putative addiction module killer protein
MLELLAYQDEGGGQPFGDWFGGLDTAAKSRITTVLERMREGNLSDVKSVGAGVAERRINWGPGYRVYFGRDGDTVVILLGGGTKKRQQRDIEDAHACWADYKRRKGK